MRRVAQKFLEGMGEHVDTGTFTASGFQRDAISAVLERDTVVVAPTGSGKTYIAVEAMRDFLRRGKTCWYTTPLKALSNQKLVQFQRIFGGENVGLVTGERQENRTAPIMIATTEILRNVLYEGDETPSFVILDEAHYLGDEERGTTWEEIVILAPDVTRFLLLSATIPNADELCAWMERIRHEKPELVRCDDRPVPLRYGFLDGRRIPLPLDAGHTSDLSRGRGQKKLPKLSPRNVFPALEQHKLLPAIIFLPTRKKCDEWAEAFQGTSAKGVNERRALFDELSLTYPQILSHELRHTFIYAGVAPHHAGHLTPWRIFIEHALDRGLLRAVFATTTLAAGLDVPARTVVLTQLWRFSGKGSTEELNATEFHQMTGRAGRRGKDKVGFVIMLPERRNDFSAAKLLRDAEAEPLRSAFRMAYYQLLNLLPRLSLKDVETFFLEKSFFAFQYEKQHKDKHSHSPHSALRNPKLHGEFMTRARFLQHLGYLDGEFHLTPLGQWAKGIRHECSLYITENIRHGAWEWLTPPELAGRCAIFISQRTARPTESFKRWQGMDVESVIKEVRHVKRMERDFHIHAEQYLDLKNYFDIRTRAQVVFGWAQGMEWETLCRETGLWEGDLQRLILQTEELLHQLSDLPLPVADVAQKARELLFRPPVT